MSVSVAAKKALSKAVKAKARVSSKISGLLSRSMSKAKIPSIMKSVAPKMSEYIATDLQNRMSLVVKDTMKALKIKNPLEFSKALMDKDKRGKIMSVLTKTAKKYGLENVEPNTLAAVADFTARQMATKRHLLMFMGKEGLKHGARFAAHATGQLAEGILSFVSLAIASAVQYGASMANSGFADKLFHGMMYFGMDFKKTAPALRERLLNLANRNAEEAAK